MDDLSKRKYHFIEELMSIEDANIMDALERVLKQEKKDIQTITSAQKQELDKRLKSYSKDPEDLLDWQEVKKNW